MAKLSEIAEMHGVTTTTVSHVLRNRLGHIRVGEAKRKQIIETAHQLGYIPDLRARSLASRKSFTLGFIASWQESTHFGSRVYFFDVLRGIDQACQSVNYHCLFASYPLTDPDKFTWPRCMRDGGVDGVVLAGYTHDVVLKRLASLNFPCVQVGSNVDPGFGVDRVYADLDGVLQEVARRLVEWGHRRIQLILPSGPGPEAIANNFRCLGEMINGLNAEAVLLRSHTAEPEEARVHARLLLHRSDRPTAYLCDYASCNPFADVLSAGGLSCPRDYSLVAIGSLPMSEQRIFPSGATISTIVIPARQAGYIAAKRLLTRLSAITNDEKVNERDVRLPCEILYRDSCRSIAIS